jgi:hypothetical protein
MNKDAEATSVPVETDFGARHRTTALRKMAHRERDIPQPSMTFAPCGKEFGEPSTRHQICPLNVREVFSLK